MADMNRQFTQGFAVAVAALAREHGMPSVALDIMNMNGYTFDDFVNAGVEEFDLKPLREECKNDAQKRKFIERSRSVTSNQEEENER